MRILMIAPPGAGKGTQGALISAHFDIPHIATGELLRDHVARRTALGQAVRAYLDRGELVPDQIVLDMTREAIIAAKAAGGGYVLDGIPRNLAQARAAYEIARELGMTADVALHLQAGDAELTRRLLARAALEHRSDDTAEVIAQRLAVYHAVTSPILAWYRDRGILVSVDAMRPAPEVGHEILAALETLRPSLDHAPAPEPPPADLTSLGQAFGATGSATSTSELAAGDHRRCAPERQHPAPAPALAAPRLVTGDSPLTPAPELALNA
jgi:adenylate kinase